MCAGVQCPEPPTTSPSWLPVCDHDGDETSTNGGPPVCDHDNDETGTNGGPPVCDHDNDAGTPDEANIACDTPQQAALACATPQQADIACATPQQADLVCATAKVACGCTCAQYDCSSYPVIRSLSNKKGEISGGNSAEAGPRRMCGHVCVFVDAMLLHSLVLCAHVKHL